MERVTGRRGDGGGISLICGRAVSGPQGNDLGDIAAVALTAPDSTSSAR
jgi:hypothetical protein